MERQDTQPVFSEDLEFSSLLELHPSLMADNLLVFEDLPLSSDECNKSNDMKFQQQQFQQNQDQQLHPLQQQQQDQLQQQHHRLLNHSQNEQENIRFSQHMHVATMKQEVIDGPGISLQSSDSLSSTPPEMLRGVPYSAVHSITSDAVNETSSFMEPFSPATLEASNVIFPENKCIPLPVEQPQSSIALHDDREKKFAPRDQKFILPSSSNEIMGGLGGNNPGLTRTKTIDVTTLNDWPGDYNFQIKVVPSDKHKNKWCYSSKVHRLYCYPMLAAEVQVSVNDWMKASGHNAVVRLVAVYQDAHNRTKPVHRCHNCKKSDKTSLDLMEHMVQVSNSGAVHNITGSRYTVSVPMERSHLGEDSVTLLIRCTCMSSCVGGPNRRPFALLFSLMMNGEEKGRQILSTKCCKGPNRDIKKDETDHDRQLGLVVENTTNNTNSADSAADCSPKKANIAIAGGSGLHVALSSPKCAATKRKSAGKKVLIPADLFSSDSEPDRSSSKKTKLGNSSGRGTGAIPEGYVNLIIPDEFKDDMLKYAELLQARKFIKTNKLNVLKSVYLS